MSAIGDLDTAWRRCREAPCVEGAVGYIGLDVPAELISAAGFSPVRVVAKAGSAGAEAFAEGGGHPLLRALTAALTEGPYRGLERLVVSTTPSSYGYLFSFLRELKRGGDGLGGMEICLFDLNHGAAMGEARRRSVVGLAAQLEAWGGKPVEAGLGEAITQANGTRALLRQVQALRAARTLTGIEALAVFGARDAMAAGEYQASVGAFLGETRSAMPGTPTVYSGAETLDADLYGRLEAGGALIVADDQDAGSRAIGPDVETGGDPLAALAQRYFRRDPAPAKSGIGERSAYLVAVARASGAQRVVFNLPAFDHPPAWDLPSEIRALDAAGIGCEVLDV